MSDGETKTFYVAKEIDKEKQTTKRSKKPLPISITTLG